jgi:hypothetical protein
VYKICITYAHIWINVHSLCICGQCFSEPCKPLDVILILFLCSLLVPILEPVVPAVVMTTSLESTFGKRHKGLSIRNFIKEKGPASNIEHTPTTNKMQYTPLTSKSIGNLPSMYLNDNHDGYNYNNEEDEMELIQELEVVPQRHEAQFVPSESTPYQNAWHGHFAPLNLNRPLDTSTARQLSLSRKASTSDGSPLQCSDSDLDFQRHQVPLKVIGKLSAKGRGAIRRSVGHDDLERQPREIEADVSQSQLDRMSLRSQTPKQAEPDVLKSTASKESLANLKWKPPTIVVVNSKKKQKTA